jgi:hypothetical protein
MQCAVTHRSVRAADGRASVAAGGAPGLPAGGPSPPHPSPAQWPGGSIGNKNYANGHYAIETNGLWLVRLFFEFTIQKYRDWFLFSIFVYI